MLIRAVSPSVIHMQSLTLLTLLLSVWPACHARHHVCPFIDLVLASRAIFAFSLGSLLIQSFYFVSIL